MIQAKNGNDLYREAIRLVLQNGSKVSPRGLGCTEVLGPSLTLTDPRKSLITLGGRKLAYKFNAAEKLCYITGDGGETVLPKYAPNISKFINQKGKFDGAYGPRLIRQYDVILERLKKDPMTRQALLTIHNFHDDLHEGSLDYPCTISLQFLLRDGKLNLITTMRSNDLMWGFPYDVSQFTFIQECFAMCLGVELGWYQHQVGSLHIYDTGKGKLEELLKTNECFAIEQEHLDVSDFDEIRWQARQVLDGVKPESKYFQSLYDTLYGKSNL